MRVCALSESYFGQSTTELIGHPSCLVPCPQPKTPPACCLPGTPGLPEDVPVVIRDLVERAKVERSGAVPSTPIRPKCSAGWRWSASGPPTDRRWRTRSLRRRWSTCRSRLDEGACHRETEALNLPQPSAMADASNVRRDTIVVPETMSPAQVRELAQRKAEAQVGDDGAVAFLHLHGSRPVGGEHGTEVEWRYSYQVIAPGGAPTNTSG